jgi:hypothetical protein
MLLNRGVQRLSHRFIMLRQIAGMIEMAGLQLGAADRDLGKGGFRENIFRDIVDRNIRDFMNEADIFVFAGDHARDDFAPGNLWIDDGFAPAPSVIDHHDKIVHGALVRAARDRACERSGIISENQKFVGRNSENQKFSSCQTSRY